MKPKLAITGTFIFLPFLFCQKAECEHPGIKTPLSVAIVGDSRMFDITAQNFGGFTNYLNANPERNAFKGTRFVFEDNDPTTTSTIPGSDFYSSVANTALLAKANFPKVLPNGHDALLLSLGVNCTGDPRTTIDTMNWITETARAHGWLVMITTIGPWKSYVNWAPFYQRGTEAINEWIRSTASRGYIVIDSYRALEDKKNPGTIDPSLTLDGLHYSPAGHARVAEEANRMMTEAKRCQDR
jgi:hypothetical protein